MDHCLRLGYHATAMDGQSGKAVTHRWEQRVGVAFDYPVLFTRGILAPHNEVLRDTLVEQAGGDDGRRCRVFVVIDSGVAKAWPGLQGRIQAYFEHYDDVLELAAPPRELVGGEAAKNDPALIFELQAAFFEAHLDRHSTVMILGGGAVLDAAGYAAALAHRGIRVVRLPTTVLAQNDAGVGVKNGINAFGHKNALGTFAPPSAVINDLDFVFSLSERDRLAGMAEAVKVALIKDADFFEWLVAHAHGLRVGEPEATAYMIRRCAELHLEHIRDGGDPFENGSARPLDFGHWSAHKLEVLSGHGLRHGEAVSVGITIDSRYSVEIGRLAPEAAERIEALLVALGLPIWHEAQLRRTAKGELEVLVGLEEFREHLGGELTLTLLEGLGRGFEIHEIDHALMTAVVESVPTHARAG